MRSREDVIDWLMQGDPAIRWQAMRDLADAAPADVHAERARVAREGWGAEILERQRADGSWGPSDGPADAPDPGWMITIRTLTLLADMGIDPADAAVRAAIERVKPLRFEWHDNRPFFAGESEPCLNGRILGLGAYFGEPNEALLARLLSEQLADGGWNCNAPPSTVSSFDTTICVLEGLLAWEQAVGFSSDVTAARIRAHEYLLARRLMFGLRSGAVVEDRFTRFAWHPNWQYDVLRALNYFHAAGVTDGRMADAIALVEARRSEDGRWPLDRMGPNATGYLTETEIGAPSRWNTLRAMRVLSGCPPTGR